MSKLPFVFEEECPAFDDTDCNILDDADFMEVESNYSPMLGLFILVLTVAGFIVLIS
jgi:hypothetical protein